MELFKNHPVPWTLGEGDEGYCEIRDANGQRVFGVKGGHILIGANSTQLATLFVGLVNRLALDESGIPHRGINELLESVDDMQRKHVFNEVNRNIEDDGTPLILVDGEEVTAEEGLRRLEK